MLLLRIVIQVVEVLGASAVTFMKWGARTELINIEASLETKREIGDQTHGGSESKFSEEFIVKNAVLFLLACLACTNSIADDWYMIDPRSRVNKLNQQQAKEVVRIFGDAEYIGISEYERSCSLGEICLEEYGWHYYNITGSILSEFPSMESLSVAYKGRGPLLTSAPWLATLQKIEDDNLRRQLKADFILIGVELGGNYICPNSESLQYFDKWDENAFVDDKNDKCFWL